MSTGVKQSFQYSAIVLLEERDEDFLPLLYTLHRVLSQKKGAHEIIVVANGTGTYLRNALKEIPICNCIVKTYEFPTKVSHSVCLKAGFEESSGEIIIVCGSHRQITEHSLARLIDALDEHTDIINSWRTDRTDSSFNQFQSKVFNAVVRKITHCQVHDLSSAVKVYRRRVLDSTEYYGNMHRFLPIVAAGKGFKTKELACEHYRWRGRTGVCSASEYLERLAEIFTIYFITAFKNKPLRFFSLLGTLFFLLGITFLVYIFADRMIFGHPLGGRNILLIGVLSMVLGVQVASMGLLGEIIAFTHGRHKRQYNIEKEI